MDDISFLVGLCTGSVVTFVSMVVAAKIEARRQRLRKFEGLDSLRRRG